MIEIRTPRRLYSEETQYMQFLRHLLGEPSEAELEERYLTLGRRIFCRDVARPVSTPPAQSPAFVPAFA